MIAAATSSALLERILQAVQEEHPELVRAWFPDIELVRWEQGTMELLAANEAQRRYLDRFCQRAFAEAAQAATGRLVSLLFSNEMGEDDEGGTKVSGHVRASRRTCHPSTQTYYPSLAESFLGLPGDGLNPEFTFERFIEGPSNRLALSAAMAVSRAAVGRNNPLFIHGGPGLGKTHLLHAAAQALKEELAGETCPCLPCDVFSSHLIESVESRKQAEFRAFYHSAGGFFLDDLDRIAGREQSQEALFHIVETLIQLERPVVLAGRAAPREIPNLADRLASRFASGLVVQVEPADLETRMAIVRSKADWRGIELTEPVVQILAEAEDGNVRELERLLIRCDARSRELTGVITAELVREILGEGWEEIEVTTILEAVGRKCRVPVSELLGKERSRSILLPRRIAMYLARQLTHHGLEELGRRFGGRSHTTVQRAAHLVGRRLPADERLRRIVGELTWELQRRRD